MIAGLKRYPAYKNSGLLWLGEIPAHWEPQRAKWLFRKMDRPVGENDGVVTCFRDGTVTLRKNRRLRGFTESLKEIGYQGILRGDLVIRAMDAFAGAVGVSDSDGKGTPVYSVCEAASGVSADFYAYAIREMARSQWILALTTGIRERSTDFRFEGFALQNVPLPSVAEQNAIVRFLDHADRQIRRYIRAKKKLITLLNEQEQAIVHRTVTRGLDMKAPTKPPCIEWLGNVPQDWRRVRLKQVATVQTGITLGKVYGDTPLIERPYLRVANVQSGRVELSKITTVRLPPAEAAGATLVAGDVLMTEGGDIDKLGRGCVWHGEISECLHQNHVFAVRTDVRTLLPEFLVAVMGSRHGRAYFQTTAKQTTNLAATSSTTLGNLPLWLPTTDVQQQILHWIAVNTAEIDGAAVQALREVGLLHEYRSRLVADVVTGKIDVREAAVPSSDASTPSADEELLADAAAESDPADLDDAEAEVIA